VLSLTLSSSLSLRLLGPVLVPGCVLLSPLELLLGYQIRVLSGIYDLHIGLGGIRPHKLIQVGGGLRSQIGAVGEPLQLLALLELFVALLVLLHLRKLPTLLALLVIDNVDGGNYLGGVGFTLGDFVVAEGLSDLGGKVII
jgi:hypothetical protein